MTGARTPRKVNQMSEEMKDSESPPSQSRCSSSNVENALYEAIGAIYFADNSDYLSALWTVVSLLGGEEAVELLERDPSAAWHKYDPETIAKITKDKHTKDYME